MLNFFRKHQKFFFFVVTFFVVASFSFFGAFRSYAPATEVSAKVVGKAIDGSSITDRELVALERVITTETERSGLPNLLHGDFLETVLLEPKVADDVVAAFFPLVQADLQERLERVKNYVPYAHPEAPFINSMEVWTTFAPKVKEAYQRLMVQKEATPETFSLLSTIYREQKNFSQDFIRKMLHIQLKQYSWLREDPLLNQRNLSLFGFESVKDWFGSSFIQLVSRCVVNGAAVARERGHRITVKEAKGDLIHNVLTSAEAKFNQQVSIKEAQGYLRNVSRLLGLDEKDISEAWQKAILFRNLLSSVGDGVFHDPLLYDTFTAFAAEKATVELYELPKELKFSSFTDLMKFQFYLEQTAPDAAKELALPTKLLTAAEVEKRCPELVEERLHLKIASVNLEELALGITLRETWGWQGEEASFKALQGEFEELQGVVAATSEERLDALEALGDDLRERIDAKSRLMMVKANTQRIQEALSQAEGREEWVSFRSKGGEEALLTGVKDTRALLSRLKSEGRLENFSEDGVHIYTIELLEKGGEKEVLTFAKARNDKVFVARFDKKLEEAYPKVRQRDENRFKRPDGSWRPLSEVKETVGAYLFATVMREIDNAEKSQDEKISFSFYAANRFAPFMRSLLERVERGEDVSEWIENDSRPWTIARRTLDITRGKSQGVDADELFSLKEGQWSHVTSKGALGSSFYKLIALSKEDVETSTTLGEKGKAALASEAKRAFFKEVTDRLKSQEVIALRQEEEL